SRIQLRPPPLKGRPPVARSGTQTMVRHLASRAATAAIASLLFVHSTTAAGWQHMPGWGGFFGASQSSNANLVSCDLDGNGRPDLAALGSTWNVVDTGGESAGTVGVLEADA